MAIAEGAHYDNTSILGFTLHQTKYEELFVHKPILYSPQL